MHLLQTLFRLAAASVVIAATEMSLQWNNITGVYDATTAAQLIPIILASGLLCHVFWVFFVATQQDDDSESTSTTTYISVEGIEIIVD